MRTRISVVALLTLLASSCGGGSTTPTITVQPALTYKLAGFKPVVCVRPGKRAPVTFTIRQPDGTALVDFKRGPGPHTGVHLIYVRDDLSVIIHHHPALHGKSTIRDTVTLPAPGPYRLVIDVYPAVPVGAQPNYQLFQTVRGCGAYKPVPPPPTSETQTVGGYRFTLSGAANLHAIQAQLVHVTVTGPQGKPVAFQTYFGALAHAIFFRQGSLDYFHTHVCAADTTGCTSVLGATRVTGHSTIPGQLNVGVLVPVAGTWRLFLQIEANGRILTAPFTLHVT